MTTDGDVCWQRSFAGRNPSRIAIADDIVACSYVDDQGKPGALGRHRLVCFDLAGDERWSARDFQLELALPGRLIGTTRSGKLRVLDLDGRKGDGLRDGRKAVRCSGVVDVTRERERILVRSNRELTIADLQLNVTARWPVPPGLVAIDDDGEGYVVRKDKIVRWNSGGAGETLCPIPLKTANDAMDRWERDTGVAALHGVWMGTIDPKADFASELVGATDPVRQRILGLGDRTNIFSWGLSYVAATSSLFAFNTTHPHLLTCIGLDGVTKWCTYLSPQCCGGPPVALPNGRLAVSCGCGGIVTWLDSNGSVVARSPQNGFYNSRVRSLSDSTCIIEGAPGVVSYTSDGQEAWRCSGGCSCYDYDEHHKVLVTADWKTEGNAKSVSITCYRNLSIRAARA